jgi:Flp pilus assembly protein TadD
MTANTPHKTHTRAYLAALGLAVLTVVVYLPALGHDFVGYDDGTYVTENEQVLRGFTLPGVAHAFRTGETGTWQPLALLSHMLDCEMFGVRPWGHHLTSILLHAANTFLLAVALIRMTGSVAPSLFVAAVFGLHPLHVESVAWVSERKDVLSALCWMLTLLTYVQYVRRPDVPRYLLVLAAFGLGLMAKPMLVSLPFILLFLDHWPFRRWDKFERGHHFLVLWEKAPLFALAIAAGVLTVIVQRGAEATSSFEALPLSMRVNNALVSYAAYIHKTLWPADLAVYYPHPRDTLSLWTVIGCTAILLLITVVTLAMRRQQPWLVVGWFWYLSALGPVIGLIQVGTQAMADRYSYIPMIGLSIMAAWGVPAVLRFPRDGVVLRALAVVLLSALTWRMSIQLSYWRDSETLFRHALDVTDRNEVARMGLAITLIAQGRNEEALPHLEAALDLNPTSPDAHYHYALACARLGRTEEAKTHYEKTLEINPRHGGAYNNLGKLAFEERRFEEAARLFKQAIDAEPRNVEAVGNYGLALCALERFGEAESQLRAAIASFPESATLRNNLGVALKGQGRIEEAAEAFRNALRVEPGHPDATRNLEVLVRAAGSPGAP